MQVGYKVNLKGSKMLKPLVLLLATASPALAQMTHTDGMTHSGSTMAGMAPQGIGGSPLFEGGQSAFTAIAEVVNALKADPNTNWAAVDINALRDHLRDMDIVTVDSTVATTDITSGQRFEIIGEGEVTAAVRRMAKAHVGMMDGADGWVYTVEDIDGGVAMRITTPEADLPMLKGLGFYGIMASGMHHQPHHWAMATGGNPHAH